MFKQGINEKGVDNARSVRVDNARAVQVGLHTTFFVFFFRLKK